MDPIQWTDIITMLGLLVTNLIIVIVAWNRNQVKLKQIDVELQGVKSQLMTHIEWGEKEQRKNETKFEDIVKDNSVEHKDISSKMDAILEKLTDFQIAVAKKLK